VESLRVCARSKRQKEEAMRNWGEDVSAERGVYRVYVYVCVTLIASQAQCLPTFTWNDKIDIDGKLDNRVMHIGLGCVVVSHHPTST